MGMFTKYQSRIGYSSSMPWRSVSAMIGWLGGSVAAFVLFPFWLALPFVIGFQLFVIVLNRSSRSKEERSRRSRQL
jgi:hypothetical protein